MNLRRLRLSSADVAAKPNTVQQSMTIDRLIFLRG